MNGKTVLITGGNTGIGKEAAVALAKQGARVFITSRSPEKGEAAVADIRERSGAEGPVDWLQLDLASFASIRAMADDFMGRCEELHVLLNNAGVFLSERSETQEGFESTFGVNHVGHFLLTKLLLARLTASEPARIVNVSSDAHRMASKGLDFNDLQAERSFTGYGAYAKSKLANILFTRELASRLEGTGVTANSLHPGVVATRFSLDGDSKGIVPIFYKVAKPFLRTPEKGARTLVYLSSSPELEGVTGRYFANRKQKRPNAAARDEEAAKRLWEVSESLVS